jgi:hypothetical protein
MLAEGSDRQGVLSSGVMFSLSLRERIFVTAVLSAVMLGVAVKHWRDAQREARSLPSTGVLQVGANATPAQASLVRVAPGESHP